MKLIFDSQTELIEFIDVFVKGSGKEEVKIKKDLNINDLGFNTKTVNCLRRFGIKKLSQLSELYKGNEVSIPQRKYDVEKNDWVGADPIVVRSIDELERYVKGLGMGTTDHIKRILKTIY